MNKEIINIEKGEIEDIFIKYEYPTNFNIIDREVYSKILTILKKEDKEENFLLKFIIKDKKIFLKLKNNDYFKTTGDKKYYIYGYSITNRYGIEFTPEFILCFYYKYEMDKFFEGIINEKNLNFLNNNPIKLNGQTGKLIKILKKSEDKIDNKRVFNQQNDQQSNQLNSNNYKVNDIPSKNKTSNISNNSYFKNKNKQEKNILEEEIEKYKIENNILKKEIERLKNEKENEIKNSNKLSEEIFNLKKLEKENNFLMNELKNEINEQYLLLEKYKKYKIKYKELLEKFLKKKEEINELNKKLSRYPIELDEGEKLLSLTILSTDENIMTNIICKNTDKFNIIEDKLYKEYPQYIENEYYFTANGKDIKLYKNFDDNKICNNNIIILKNKKYKDNY